MSKIYIKIKINAFIWLFIINYKFYWVEIKLAQNLELTSYFIRYIYIKSYLPLLIEPIIGFIMILKPVIQKRKKSTIYGTN